MEVKPGYKQTEVGVIPEEWDVAKVAELVTTGPKNGYSGRSGKEARGTPTLSLGATSSGSMVLNEETVKRLDESIPKNADLYLKPGDVLVQRSNTQDLVGTTAVFDGPAGVYVYPDLMMRMRFRDAVTAHFFWRYANSTSGRRFFVSIAAGSSGSMPKISGEKLRKMPLPLPPLPEQRAIAAALSDVDGLLGGLDRLIAKKRDLKQAAMQQLLTGQTRLPGFHGEWEVKRLGDVLKVRHGKSQHGITVSDGEYPILASGGEIGRTNTALYDKPSVLIGRKGTIDSPQYAATPFWTVDTLFFTEISAGADAKFVFYKFTMIPWRSYNEASGVPSLNAKTIENIEALFPSTKAEQTAIAAVLSEMDGELAVLEQRREKTRALKQAMMQELLTGRTRLI